MKVDIQDRVTLCMKTFERPECAQKLIASIRKYYPTIRIIIADDSKEHPIDFEQTNNVTHLILPFYQGCGIGRNAALNNVETEYFVTMDDDFIFNAQTNLARWVDILDQTDIDMVGGRVDIRNYEGLIEKNDDAIRLVNGSHGECAGLKLYDVVLQFWMGRTDVIRGAGGWDEDFKTQDHKSFFLKHLGEFKTAYCPSVFCHHIRRMPKHYVQYRHGESEKKFLRLILEKYGGKKLVEFGVETARL